MPCSRPHLLRSRSDFDSMSSAKSMNKSQRNDCDHHPNPLVSQAMTEKMNASIASRAMLR